MTIGGNGQNSPIFGMLLMYERPLIHHLLQFIYAKDLTLF